MRRTADDVIRIGQQLSHMKEKVLLHGSFLPWIEAEFEMTHKTATNFMNMAAKFGAS